MHGSRIYEKGTGATGALLYGVQNAISDFANIHECLLVLLRNHMNGGDLIIKRCKTVRRYFEQINSLFANVAEVSEEIVDGVSTCGGGGSGWGEVLGHACAKGRTTRSDEGSFKCACGETVFSQSTVFSFLTNV
jgi:hypothetical protein